MSDFDGIPGLRKGKQNVFFSRTNNKGKYKKVEINEASRRKKIKVSSETRPDCEVQNLSSSNPNNAAPDHAISSQEIIGGFFAPASTSVTVQVRKGRRDRTEDKKKNATVWRDVKETFINVIFSDSTPLTNVCMKCEKHIEKDDIIRCKKCYGPGGVPFHSCRDCFKESHEHLLHIPDVWSNTSEVHTYM